ncbi:E3 ubiquitin-protein ligase MBR2-like [Camellia sinensis]|uniref:E3 ubiquitin-protein ligase MBR2-like n=1 Tax=Camellia sinensis TaxID=4442 RepID=UPI001036769C|nr:E3 ubiquitin-protein ligase MBR2-like [Camellia sinensis]XP_028088089.1 E3 ubiquitin-protein ligase MBR2-like [Camellia sinensis]XP_028088091.1 E3 ubiquitin-protein ligase MBR2-like [Camellia sinensis]XP_028088092.1 E3 ubiquitin-protein ligase MBR2-like [Camellia sinensis]XP_028088093.1 E3 ubiquitin-protein ligase MBR2-like [Camellia sinensis]XP_028088094.1 E3 ubiquitin-protein ligase MBR2-like [Camellia sinensis]XP_028088095.1 E3 ubiquitin-protein ligase MBR2-like [Camellia sinensis]
MQGQRSAGNSFTETVDLNQGSVSNNTGMNQSTAWNSMLSPVESRLPNYMLSSAEGNYTCTNAVSHSARGFSGWDLGESSSSQNLQGQGIGDGMKIENGRSSSFLVRPGSGPSNILLRDSVNNGIGGNQVTDRPLIMQSSSSSRVSLNINLNAGDMAGSGDGGQDTEPDAFHNLYKVSGPETEQILSANASSDNTGNSSGHSGCLVDSEGESSSSLGNWGSSCKRKALEGTSGQSCPGGSSNCFQHTEIFPRHGVFARYSASSSLSISPPPVISPCIGPSEQLNPRSGISMRGVASDVFPPSSVTGIAESSSRIFGVRGNVGHHESVRFNLPSTGNAINHSDVCSPPQPSRPLSFTDSLDLRPTTIVAPNSNNPPNQSHSMHILDLPRNTPAFPWNGTLNSRAGGSSSSLMLSGDRGASLREEASFRSTPRNGMEHPIVVPPTEMRNSVQDSNNWNFSTGNTSTSTSVPSSSRVSPSSAIRPFPTAWTPHRNPPTQNQQRLSEFSPWTLFPSVDSESEALRAHFPPSHSGPSSSEETIMPSGANSQGHHPPYPRSALLELPGDDVNGWRALAADIEGRHRLVSEIRQVLNAMRRGENLRAEDYMLFDPFINGAAELHDRHRDMRLDVDNMSYEELLALEERIGNVSTGLSEETIMKSMQQRKYLSIAVVSQSNLEPCCICREEYVAGDDIGTLDCGHDFHTNCIKQWLTQKNLCPICKMTGLGT